MQEPRCIAQLLRNQQGANHIDFTITHGRGRKGVIIRTRKISRVSAFLRFLGVTKCQ
ncbi:hypothetical protein I5520_08485 [Citrobacter sp. FDAARGOS_156]|uniref:hypothetical protein n=1 Tax=Citrobacter sp. FDAARGOS_156 TaxID=1702170 RepID=UPI00190680A4|nr:hypothetical protein [Citrobacter sp. FDAARGOS_156]MBJ9642023.1 hypothetical protein [Citrobacter sp. FDAARGOS_156]